MIPNLFDRKLSQGHPYGILKRQHLGRNLFDVGCGNSSRKEAQERDYLRVGRRLESTRQR
uniref:Uncharacterized protein n=1 Tax=Octopus bimaculoides TaxID=37653 RepID=A0A0L8HGE3_OCTBM